MTTTSKLFIGIDVSKAELAIARSDTAGVTTIDNTQAAIRAWLKTLPGPAVIAVEATNTYHCTLLAEAWPRQHRLYVVDGYRLSRYRDSVGGRAKTDRTDAELLRRYLQREVDELRPWNPPAAAYTTIQQLLHRRATLVQAQTALRQSLADIPQLKRSLKTLLRNIARIDHQIGRYLQQAVRDAGWHDEVRRCQAIEGIGPLTAIALVTAFHRGSFQSSDAFVAFLGLDVRVRDSGKQRGQRKLTKQGDPELRRLLYNAAMAARRQPHWARCYQRYLERGLKPIQVLVVLERKLARIAFALLKQQTEYQTRSACVAT